MGDFFLRRNLEKNQDPCDELIEQLLVGPAFLVTCCEKICLNSGPAESRSIHF